VQRRGGNCEDGEDGNRGEVFQGALVYLDGVALRVP
jgi:hypothetical protein